MLMSEQNHTVNAHAHVQDQDLFLGEWSAGQYEIGWEAYLGQEKPASR